VSLAWPATAKAADYLLTAIDLFAAFFFGIAGALTAVSGKLDLPCEVEIHSCAIHLRAR